MKYVCIVCCMIFFWGCGEKVITDQKMVENYEKNKKLLRSLVTRIDTSMIGAVADHLRDTYFVLKHPKEKLTEAGVESVALDYKGCYVLLPVQRTINDDMDVLIEEKGYLYQIDESCMVQPLAENLNDIWGSDIVKHMGVDEQWRFKRIEGKFYIYYRQYFASFLH